MLVNLAYIGEYTTQLYHGDYIEPFFRIPMNQAVKLMECQVRVLNAVHVTKSAVLTGERVPFL